MHASLATSDYVWVLSNYQKSLSSSLNDSRVLALLAPHMPLDFVIKRSVKGKPFAYSATKPCPHLSVSHSGELLVLALSREPIGVDVELIKARRHIAPIANRYFSRLEAHQELIDFYRSWTAREAFVKTLGHGIAQWKKIQVQSHEDFFYIGYKPELNYKINFKLIENNYLIAICRGLDKSTPLLYFMKYQ